MNTSIENEKVISRVMLIDDDYATNYLHEIFLEESGIVSDVLVANGADEALNLLGTAIFDEKLPEIIFLDINLPAKNGWEFLDEFKQLKKDRSEDPIVIILSNSENPRDIDKANQYPIIKDFRLKPLSVDIIKSTVNQYFNN